MNVLILGGGGREHALAWKIAQSPNCEQLYTAPGNPGTAEIGTNLAINSMDFEAVKNAVLKFQISMVVIGPEAPLVNGITDFFKSDPELSNVSIIGPGRRGSELEGSKDFAKAFMSENHIPTAAYRTFTKEMLPQAKEYLQKIHAPYVLKADGLAGGKGVVILTDLDEALREIEEMLSGSKFGSASERVVIENFLDGIELSVFALTDGKDFLLLPNAKDYKRIGEGDTGLNTGGMGAISPVPFADKAFMEKVVNRIVEPTISGLQNAKIDYIGFIFFGLINVGGDPYVIEYNVRMGDPETEVVMPRIDSDLLDLLVAAANGNIAEKRMEISADYAATVMMVASGYPGEYEKGMEISGIPTGDKSLIFHAGTRAENGKICTNGGRIIAATGMGETAESALKEAYEIVEKVEFTGKFFRRDIGQDIR